MMLYIPILVLEVSSQRDHLMTMLGSILILGFYIFVLFVGFFFFSSRRRHTRYWRDWSSDVCSSDLWTKRSSSDSAASRPTTAPPTVSEWPPRYFVVECTTASAPSSSGRWWTGVANVLSTATSAFCLRSMIPARSMTLSVGFVGVSTQISAVSSRTARATASRSRWSTMSYSSPKRASTLSTRR